MVRINMIILVILSLELISCGRPVAFIDKNIGEEWKEEWISMFFTNYRSYKREKLVRCSDADRDIAFDIERKIRAISSYPINQVFFEAKRYMQANNLMDFDSMTVKIIHGPHFEHEYDHAPAFIVVTINQVKFGMTIGVNDSTVLYNDRDNFVEPEKVLHNGCGYGFVSYTYFDKFWNWKITDIIINPDF